MTMRNDATRIRIATKDKRRSRAVVARQGQVLLDTDVDQQSKLQLQRIELETLDTLGSPGRFLVPAGTSGFKITNDASGNPTIGDGHGYLDGWLLENPDACRMFAPPPQPSQLTQPHPRTTEPIAATTVVGVKALVRHVDPAEDPVLADIALGDAQASGRSLVDWQAFALLLPGSPVTCAAVTTDPTWQALTAPSTGTLTVIEQAAPPSTDPCSLTPGGGYSRLENLLYRLEVHAGEANAAFPIIDGPRFKLNNLKLKLSRRNASVMVRIVTITANEIQVAPPALDARNWFAPGLFAEIVSIHDDVDPRAALANERLFRVALATDDRVTLEATAGQIPATGVTNDGTWFLRLWDAFPDGQGLATVSAPNNANDSAEIDLGDGLRIKLSKGGGGSSGTFRRGDYWTFAARADGSVDWLKVGGVPQPMTPHGPEIRYAPLQLFGSAAASPADDCRVPFGTISDKLLLYRGGDGQSVFPDPTVQKVPLPAKLRVAVLVGDTPVSGATVRWSYVGPVGQSCTIANPVIGSKACSAGNPVDVTTDADGLAEVTWEIDRAALPDTHQVEAALVEAGVASKPPIVFSATFDVAEHVGYTPANDACVPYAGLSNVDAVLDELIKFACNPPTGDGGAGCCHTVGEAGDRKGEYPTIVEAIKDLRSHGHTHICLCLLPGEHKLDPGELKEVIDGLEELVISGRGSTVITPDVLVFIRLASVVLRDIAVHSESGQALAFQGPEDRKLHLDVELTKISVDAAEPRTGQALVTFADCRKVRVERSDLRAPASRPEVRELVPDRFAAIVEMVDTAERTHLASTFASMIELPKATRTSLAESIDRSITENREVISADEVTMLNRSAEALRAGTVPSPQRLSGLIADWRHIDEAFGPRSRGWPVAILFTPWSGGEVPADADVVLDGCRIAGGAILGNAERDLDAEDKSEAIFINGADKAGLVPDGSGRMWVQDNVLSWLAIGSEQAKLIGDGKEIGNAMQGLLFAETLVNANTFTSAPHAVVAGAVTVHGNVFERASTVGESPGVGFAAGSVASATGNLGPPFQKPSAELILHGDPDARNEAGNSRLKVPLV